MALLWAVPVEQLDYAALLPLCFEGLRETAHPYTYIARQAIADLLSAEGAGPKALPVLDRLVTPGHCPQGGGPGWSPSRAVPRVVGTLHLHMEPRTTSP